MTPGTRPLAWWSPGADITDFATFVAPAWWRGLSHVDRAAAAVRSIVGNLPTPPPGTAAYTMNVPDYVPRTFAASADGALVELTTPDWTTPWRNVKIGGPLDDSCTPHGVAAFRAAIEESARRAAVLRVTPRPLPAGGAASTTMPPLRGTGHAEAEPTAALPRTAAL
jgi:hypothetical protein